MIEEAISLLDGCYEIIELYEPKSPAQVEWKNNWLEKAKKNIDAYVNQQQIVVLE